MDKTDVAWMSTEGVNRSTMIVVAIILIMLIILLIIRAIMVRRKADSAQSRSPDSSSPAVVKPKQNKKKHRDQSSYETRAAVPLSQMRQDQMRIKPYEGTISQSPIVNTPVVHFQQGHVVQAQQIINTEKSEIHETPVEGCSSGNCGAQLQATPQLVQAQQNIHQPSKEIPAYPQRQPIVRNPQAGIRGRNFPNRAQPVRQPVQQAKVVQPEPVDEEDQEDNQEEQELQQEQLDSQPRSNYRLVRGRAE